MRSVLLFHGIQSEPSNLTVSQEEFASIVKAIRDNGYAIRPLEEVITAAPGDKVVAMTFDDGFRTVHHAAEILADYGAAATLFVVTGWVGKTNRWPGQAEGTKPQRLLNWAELEALKSAGWDLQAHTHNHPDLRQLPDSHVIREIDTCKKTLSDRLGIESTLFAYPYGYVNQRVYDLVRDRFDFALTTMLSNLPELTDPHLVPRIDGQYLWPKPVHHYFGRRRFQAYLQTRQQIRRWKSHPGEPALEEWNVA